MPKSKTLSKVITLIYCLFFANITIAESHFSFTHEKYSQNGNFEIEWIKEKETNISFFRVRKGLNNTSRKMINGFLTNYHNEYIKDYLSCTDPTDYNNDTVIDYITKNLLSFTTTSSYFCKGMTSVGNYGIKSYLYDLNSQNLLKLENIININYSPKLEDAEYKNLDGQNILTTKKIRQLVFENKGWQLKKPNKADACNYYSLSVWQSENWTYGKKGITFYPSFPTIERTTCLHPFLITFDQLYRYKNNLFPYMLGGDE